MITATNGAGHAGAPFSQTRSASCPQSFAAVTFLTATSPDWLFYSPESRNLSISLALAVEGRDLGAHAPHPPIAIGRGDHQSNRVQAVATKLGLSFRAAALMPKSCNIVRRTHGR